MKHMVEFERDEPIFVFQAPVCSVWKYCIKMRFTQTRKSSLRTVLNPSSDPGESGCNNEKQTNSFRYLKFHD